jgi:hypothetical protein
MVSLRCGAGHLPDQLIPAAHLRQLGEDFHSIPREKWPLRSTR